MRIVQISDNLPPHHKGGAEVSCAAVIGELRRRGHDVTAVTNAPDDGFRRQPGTLYVDSDCHWGRSRDPRQLVANYDSLRRALEQIEPDVIHVHTCESRLHGALHLARDFPTVYTAHNYSLDFAHGLRAARFAQRPGDILTRRSLIFAKHLVKRDRRYFEMMFVDPLPHLQRIICPSGFMKSRLQRVVDADRLVVVHNGSPDCYPDTASANDPGSMLFIGRLDNSKGISYIVKAAAELVRMGEPIAVLFVGSGDHEPQLRGTIRRLHVERVVRVAPAVPRIDYSRYPGVLVYPSVWDENCSMTIIEALAAGKVVICTAKGGNTELVRHLHNGLIVPARDAGAIAGAMKQLREEPGLIESLSQNARTTFLERFTIGRQVDQLERVYLDVIGGSPSRASDMSFTRTVMPSSSRACQG